MTEKDILNLGFVKQFSFDTIDGEPEYYYYIKKFTDGLEFITNDSNELVDDNWFIEFFNTDKPVRYYDLKDVLNLFNIIKKGLQNDK